MSQRYIDLIEKIEKQNSYSLKDKMEVLYQLRDISEKTHSMLGKNNKVLKIIVMLQLISTCGDNLDVILPFIKILL